MKRILLAAMASLSLLAALPALSTAASHRTGDHGGRVERHHRGERERRDHRREARHVVRREHFNGSAPTTTNPGTPTPAPSPAATVKSFQNGVLTIGLADGSTVGGLVTGDTRIRCEGMNREHDFATRDDGSGSNSGDGAGSGSGDRGDNGDNGDNGNDSQCIAMLQHPGTAVVSTELNIVQGAASWGEVELGL
jgi:hypothetical protein